MSIGFFLVFLLLTLTIFHSSVYRIHCSLWAGKHRLGSEHVCYFPAKSKMLATKKSRKGVTLHEVKQQNNIGIILVLCFLSLIGFLLQLWACILLTAYRDRINLKLFSCIFSEHIPLSWFKVKFMFYVDNNRFCTKINFFCRFFFNLI